jgi:hypothetical protein
MKKEIKHAVKRAKIAYGLEGTLDTTSTNSLESDPVLDPETIRHQRNTNYTMDLIEYSSMAVIISSVIGYGVYKAATKVPEVVNQAVDQLGLVCSEVYQYIEPFINS